MTSSTRKSKSSPLSRSKKRKHGSKNTGAPRREVALARVKDDLSRYLGLATIGSIVITRHGKPASVLIGFKNEDDWFEYGVENHPAFLRRISEARVALGACRGDLLDHIKP